MMTGAALAANTSRFEDITELLLERVIVYGDYVIAYVRTESAGVEGLSIKYPIKRQDGEYVLTNDLREDFFFSVLSTYIDEENMRALIDRR